MLDPTDSLPTPHTPAPGPLFESTSQAAARVASRFARQRYRQILAALATQPHCIFEVAEIIGCLDHQISGRFGELVTAGLIDRTGARRAKPATGCQCDEYRLTLIGEAVAIALKELP
jgi:hypothetical protein